MIRQSVSGLAKRSCATQYSARDLTQNRYPLLLIARWKIMFARKSPLRRCRRGHDVPDYRKAGRQSGSAADVGADDDTEQFPLLALEPHQLKLADRGEIGRAGVDLDAGQQHFRPEVL